MFYRLLSLSFLIIISIGCQREEKKIIFEGQFTHITQSKWLYISELTLEGFVTFDSTLVKNGDFSFVLQSKDDVTLRRRSTPNFYQISFTPNDALVTLAKNGETVEIQADANNLAKTYSILNGKDAQRMCQLEHQLALFIDSTDILFDIYQYAIEDDSVRAHVEDVYNHLVENHLQFLNTFIHENSSSMAIIAAFYQRYNRKIFFDEEENIELLKQIYNNLVIIYPDNDNVKFLKKRIDLVEYKLKNYDEKD